jgi:hypothetical protein
VSVHALLASTRATLDVHWQRVERHETRFSKLFTEFYEKAHIFTYSKPSTCHGAERGVGSQLTMFYGITPQARSRYLRCLGTMSLQTRHSIEEICNPQFQAILETCSAINPLLSRIRDALVARTLFFHAKLEVVCSIFGVEHVTRQ